MNTILITALTLLSASAFADLSPYELRGGEYTRTGHACKIVAAQDGTRLFVEFFDANGLKCEIAGTHLTFTQMAAHPHLYKNSTPTAEGYTFYFRPVGQEALMITTDLKEAVRDVGVLFVRQE